LCRCFFIEGEKRNTSYPFKRLEKGRDMTVIFTSDDLRSLKTGTAMATPIAESLMTICFVFFDKLVIVVNYFFLGTKQDLIHHHYTFSFFILS
jgi:hypothetical protein